jgi:hypothetical protein
MAVAKAPLSALDVLAVKESVLEVLQVAARDFERRELLFRTVRPPRKRRPAWCTDPPVAKGIGLT